MPPIITDKMFSLAFWIWDLPGLSHDRWEVVAVCNEFSVIQPDTWIGRIADRFAGWLYRTASRLSEDDDDDYNDEYDDFDIDTIVLDEVDTIPFPHKSGFVLAHMHNLGK